MPLTPHSSLRPPHSLDPIERVCAGVTLLFALFGALAIATALAGCVYKGGKITEGTDLAVGLTVPGTEGALQVNALNWLSGFRLGVAENAALTVEYSSAATNSFFGVVQSSSVKRIKAKVEPCETATPTATADDRTACHVPAAQAVGESASDAPIGQAE